MLTMWETFIRIHDHQPEHLPEPVRLLFLGKLKTLKQVFWSIWVMFESYKEKLCNAYTILETLSQIHDHHTELLLEPVHLLLLGNSNTLYTSMSILV